jgi:hypothetical protein
MFIIIIIIIIIIIYSLIKMDICLVYKKSL